jgi:hypothetical protein
VAVGALMTNSNLLDCTTGNSAGLARLRIGMITVAIDGESIFTWDGDEAAVKHVLDDFPHGAASVGMTPRALADNCVVHLSKGLRVGDEEQGQAGQEMQMVGVIWRILEAETHSAEHPGKIANYAGAVDFFVDLRTTDQGFTVQVTAHSNFDA